MNELSILAKGILESLREEDYKYHYRNDMYVAKNKAYELGGKYENRDNEWFTFR